ncbi:hypothetical protein BAUCODRAFT_35177 [Baudoinia panamericana UAMH 10762]|uniref:DUF7730 domain-containing protein n=1 Tax=Baudoinia panamericana (strain UAMH 10762) TaxID=717646 RepID=M2N7X4_BAUPA|nr:uncharacterized protein BAUCODRAFT_35177 [Baudoinia panamericana UAMH 10762]EMC95184.1 hypothetical protein BAUCODRAFT_35177 [Baudoinia panamericana UAMH 10762]
MSKPDLQYLDNGSFDGGEGFAQPIPEDRGQLKSRSGITRTVRRLQDFCASKPATPPNDYTTSPLLSLPAELREQVWRHVLESPTGSEPAHFHIYDRVVDSCTYSSYEKLNNDWLRRQRTPVTSILRTCRVIYSEAIQILYDSTDFELVLLAGLPRPKHVSDGKRDRDNLYHRNGLGRPEQCKHMLQRIRRATIVLQPGESPSAVRYQRRLQDFFSAIDYGRHMEQLTVRINVGWRRGRKPRYSEQGSDALNIISKSLYPVISPEPLSTTMRKRRVTLSLPTDEHGRKQEALGVWLRLLRFNVNNPELNIIDWQPQREHKGGSSCLARGAFGDQTWATDTSVRPATTVRLRDLIPDVPMYLLVLALTPAILIWEAHRKVEKGESWKVIPTNLLR